MHILWLKTELLHPLDKGGRIRTYQMLRHLAREHRVTYLTLDDGHRDANAVDRAEEYSTNLIRVPFQTSAKGSLRFYGELARNLASRLPYAIAKYRVPAMEAAIGRAVARDAVDLVVCDFLAPAVNMPDGLPVPTLLLQHNVEAVIWKRHAEVASNSLARAYLQGQWRRMHRFEGAQCRRFDHVVAVSPEDGASFAREYGLRDVSHVPTGVDTEYFRPSGTIGGHPYELLFTGSMDWMPNVDAVQYFADTMLGRIANEVPETSFSIVGRNPSPAVNAVAERNSRVRVTGTVPDIRPYLERAPVVVVPLRVGGGTRLKIFEAMAMEKAVVATSIGAEGLPVRNGEHLLIADTPADFAAAVTRLLRDPQYATALGRNAAELVRSRFGWEHAAARFGDICMSALEPATSTTGSLVPLQ